MAPACWESSSAARRAARPALYPVLVGADSDGHLETEALRPRERTTRRAAQKNEREESVCLPVFGLAIGKAGQPAEASPIRSARVGLVSTGQFLSDERGEGCFVNLGDASARPGSSRDWFRQPHRARSRPRTAVNGFLRQIVQNGQIVNSRWTDVDVGSARVLALQELVLAKTASFVRLA